MDLPQSFGKYNITNYLCFIHHRDSEARKTPHIRKELKKKIKEQRRRQIYNCELKKNKAKMNFFVFFFAYTFFLYIFCVMCKKKNWRVTLSMKLSQKEKQRSENNFRFSILRNHNNPKK